VHKLRSFWFLILFKIGSRHGTMAACICKFHVPPPPWGVSRLLSEGNAPVDDVILLYLGTCLITWLVSHPKSKNRPRLFPNPCAPLAIRSRIWIWALHRTSNSPLKASLDCISPSRHPRSDRWCHKGSHYLLESGHHPRDSNMVGRYVSSDRNTAEKDGYCAPHTTHRLLNSTPKL